MKAYKGINRDMVCRPNEGIEFKYEEGKTYHEEGVIIPCERGFHACLNPLDCLWYYSPNDSVYFEVELGSVYADPYTSDTKVCSGEITIGKRMDVLDICNAHYEFCKDHELARTYGNSAVEVDQKCCVAIRSGDHSHIDVGGGSSVVTMDNSFVHVGGHSAVCCGENSKIDASGYTLIEAGPCSAITCVWSCEVTAGGGSEIHAEHDCYVRTGRASDIFVGDCSVVSSLENCRIMAGEGSVVRAGDRSVVTIIGWNGYKRTAKTGIIDGITLKNNTWYRVEYGEFVNCDEEMKEKGYV